MNKVFKVLSLSFLLCLSLVIAPFHISALSDDLPSPFIGVNIYQDDIEYTGPYGTYWIYKVDDNYRVELQGVRFNTNIPLWRYDFVLDSNYVGDVTVTYNNGSSDVSSVYYVNGNHLEINIAGQVTTFNISNVHLNNIGVGSSWNFPIESFNIINQQFQYDYPVLNYIGKGQYIFPVFDIKNGNSMGQLWTGGPNAKIIYIFGVDCNLQMSNYTNSLTFENCTVDSIQELYFSNTLTIKKFILTSTNTSGAFVSVKSKYDAKYMPIYFNTEDQQQFASTDFAINFGLQNNVMRDIDHIANGTESSNQSSSNLNDKTNDLNTSSNQLVSQEDNFNNDMNSALQNINTGFNVGTNFGSKFIASADWVKTQYDRITGNTPFGSVISFSLLIGLALLLVGKVFK